MLAVQGIGSRSRRLSAPPRIIKGEREKDGDTDRQPQRQTDGQADRQTERGREN